MSWRYVVAVTHFRTRHLASASCAWTVAGGRREAVSQHREQLHRSTRSIVTAFKQSQGIIKRKKDRPRVPRAEGLFEDNGVAEHKPKVGCACNQATESVIPWSSFSCVVKRRRRCRCLLPHCAVVTVDWCGCHYCHTALRTIKKAMNGKPRPPSFRTLSQPALLAVRTGGIPVSDVEVEERVAQCAPARALQAIANRSQSAANLQCSVPKRAY